jgi:hypothetical protein
MKRFFIAGSLIIFLLSVNAGCSSTAVITTNKSTEKVPPGQMKKATGTQSAKPFAPGQQKKKTKKNKH